MKTIQKKTLDEAIRISRKYWATGDIDVLQARYAQTVKLSEQSFGSNYKWCAFNDLIDSVLHLNKGATNELIYAVFALVGINVTEETA